jgi:hypothetical protein
MMRALCVVVGITLVSIPLRAAQAQQSGISSLYIAVGTGQASFVGKYSSRTKCIKAANVASRETITINGPSNQPQIAVVLFCVPSGS